MYRFLISVVAVVSVTSLMASYAKAADVQPRPLPPVVYAPLPPTWNGWYVGGNLGVAWFDPRVTSDLPQDRGNLKINSVDFSTGTQAGVTGGVQGGYNWQWSPQWVVGVEADIDATSLRASAAVSTGFASLGVSTDVNWLASIRGRVGYLWWPNLMLYGTAGVAFADIRDRATFTAFSVGGSVEERKVQTGFVVGGGAEYAWSREWTVRAEYLFYDFDSRNQTLGVFRPVNAHWDNLGISVIRLGANYRF